MKVALDLTFFLCWHGGDNACVSILRNILSPWYIFVYVCVQKFTDAWGEQFPWWGGPAGTGAWPFLWPLIISAGRWRWQLQPWLLAASGCFCRAGDELQMAGTQRTTPNSNKSSACNNDRSREKTGSYNKAASVTHLRQAFKIHHYLPGPTLRWADMQAQKKDVLFAAEHPASPIWHAANGFFSPPSFYPLLRLKLLSDWSCLSPQVGFGRPVSPRKGPGCVMLVILSISAQWCHQDQGTKFCPFDFD